MGRRKKLGKLWEKLGDDPEVIMRGDGADVFIVVDGVKIARRGYPNTPQAQTWVSLEPAGKSAASRRLRSAAGECWCISPAAVRAIAAGNSAQCG